MAGKNYSATDARAFRDVLWCCPTSVAVITGESGNDRFGMVVGTFMRSGSAHNRAELLAGMISRIDLHEAGIDLTVDKEGLLAAIKIELPSETASRSITLTFPATKVRRGHELRLVIPAPQVVTVSEVRPLPDQRLGLSRD